MNFHQKWDLSPTAYGLPHSSCHGSKATFTSSHPSTLVSMTSGSSQRLLLGQEQVKAQQSSVRWSVTSSQVANLQGSRGMRASWGLWPNGITCQKHCWGCRDQMKKYLSLKVSKRTSFVLLFYAHEVSRELICAAILFYWNRGIRVLLNLEDITRNTLLCMNWFCLNFWALI